MKIIHWGKREAWVFRSLPVRRCPTGSCCTPVRPQQCCQHSCRTCAKSGVQITETWTCQGRWRRTFCARARGNIYQVHIILHAKWGEICGEYSLTQWVRSHWGTSWQCKWWADRFCQPYHHQRRSPSRAWASLCRRPRSCCLLS